MAELRPAAPPASMPDAVSDALPVQVCYATPAREWWRALAVAPGTTIEQAIVQSGLLAELSGVDLASHPVGLYGKKKPLDTLLRAHDRIEIYRPLIADPKESRRRRADRKTVKPAPAA